MRPSERIYISAIENVLKNFVSAETRLVDPAAALVEKVSKWKLNSFRQNHVFTTGDTGQMRRSARLAFGVGLQKIETIKL